ncbi:MAG: enoyl-CoA hydratase/isomerase family protein [Hyphomicrobiales bacterium]|nr:enoyl-CoA hydratase/isomerase family protein [Hyphomicrobiales bacterium]
MSALPESPEFIKLERKGPVLFVWLNKPETRNALVAGMGEELRQTFTALKTMPDVRVVVLRGAGGTFCAGGDLKNFNAASKPLAPGERDLLKEGNRNGGALFQMIDEARQAVIIVVEGFAMGGGFGMACLGDITIAHADAQFAMTEVTLGIVPAQISPFVVRRIGLTAARRFGVSGGKLNGRQARDIGIAHEVAENNTDLETTIEANIVQVLKCAPNAVAITKALMHRVAQGGLPMDELLDQAADDFVSAVRSDEGREGTSAFVEKRKPAWNVGWGNA